MSFERIALLVQKLGLYAPLKYVLSPDFRRNWRVARAIIEKHGTDELLAIQKKYPSDRSDKGPRKYLRVWEFLPTDVARAIQLGLDRGLPRRILDIGCGNGYFLAVGARSGMTYWAWTCQVSPCTTT